MFRTIYSNIERVKANSGDRVKIEYQLRVTDSGKTLVETGKTDLYEYIQSHADSVDIHKILERCAMMDDYSLLNRMPSQFMDVSEMPKNLAEAYAAVKDAENFFDRMPVNIKEKYDNNFVTFLQDLGSEHFNTTVSDFLDSMKPKPDVDITPVPDKPVVKE